jgi:SAM-dependent methyltransferase
MPTWNELFLDGSHVAKYPEADVQKFVSMLERQFAERPLRLWDVCCGAGRHTVAVAGRGHEVYASDGAPNGVERTRTWLAEAGLRAAVAVADMTICPWEQASFHGAFSWDAIHHNTVANIDKAIGVIFDRLVPGGLFMGTLKSTKADSCGVGREIEPHTFVAEEGHESGVLHHHFDEKSIRALFRDWEILILAEQVVKYVEWFSRPPGQQLFRHTCWNVLARKR